MRVRRGGFREDGYEPLFEMRGTIRRCGVHIEQAKNVTGRTAMFGILRMSASCLASDEKSARLRCVRTSQIYLQGSSSTVRSIIVGENTGYFVSPRRRVEPLA